MQEELWRQVRCPRCRKVWFEDRPGVGQVRIFCSRCPRGQNVWVYDLGTKACTYVAPAPTLSIGTAHLEVALVPAAAAAV